MTRHWEQRMYRTTVRTLGLPPGSRPQADLDRIDAYFRTKDSMFAQLSHDTLLDVIQHCEFVTRNLNDVIIHQGEKGHRFYIILRGRVSVLHKDALEDVDLGEEGEPRSVDRATLGTCLVQLGEGRTFGEVALMMADCIRTASVVADERTDLIVIHRDLYNRSIAKVIARDYAEKMTFIDSIPLFRDWPLKWRKHLATSFVKRTYTFDVPLFRQGDPATDMFFIVSGEVKLVVDPEKHYDQYDRYMRSHTTLLEEDASGEQSDSASAVYFPVKMLPQIRRLSRVTRTQQRGGLNPTPLPQTWSPSAIRKMNADMTAHKVNLSLCYLGEKQYVGDVEFVLGLDVYHASAVCSQETVTMALHKPHFERLFKRRNPRSIKALASTLELQLSRRLLKPSILDCAPIFKAFIFQLRQLACERHGAARAEREDTFTVPPVCYKENRADASLLRAQAKQYSWLGVSRQLPASCRPLSSSSEQGAGAAAVPLNMLTPRSVNPIIAPPPSSPPQQQHHNNNAADDYQMEVSSEPDSSSPPPRSFRRSATRHRAGGDMLVGRIMERQVPAAAGAGRRQGTLARGLTGLSLRQHTFVPAAVSSQVHVHHRQQTTPAAAAKVTLS